MPHALPDAGPVNQQRDVRIVRMGRAVQRAEDAGYTGEWVGENCARGEAPFPPKDAVQGWMDSPGHRFTLLSGMWSSVGMVVVHGKPGSKFGVFWAADFGV